MCPAAWSLLMSPHHLRDHDQRKRRSAVKEDILATLERPVPRQGDYRHLEGNADAHIKASLMGFDVMLIVEGGALVLGTWQGVFLAEFDGPRNRSVLLKIIPDTNS